MHTSSRMGPAALLSLVLMACGGEDEEDGPVSSRPLSGTVDGRPFTAASAIAFTDTEAPGNKLIQISEAEQECTNLGDSFEGRRDINLNGPWNVHTAPLSLENVVGVIVYKGDSPTIGLMASGKVEYVETPTAAGSVGKLRLRGANSKDSIEGEVSVKVCD
ncbi:hypothetical protein [Stigmatella aurantiaca]|nr:hypothetical protein [Stigmatella aurantiaca]